MHQKSIHRIYTEDKNKRSIVRMASERFESFTVQPTRGDYRGQRERSMVLEIVEGSVAEVQNLARAIAAMNGQEVGAGD
jgi:hypothetical protein